MSISKISEENGKLIGGFTVLTLSQIKKVRGGTAEPGGDNCDCTNSGKKCKVRSQQ